MQVRSASLAVTVTVLLLLVAPSAGLAIPANATSRSTACYFIGGINSSHKSWNTADLVASAKGYGWLNSDYSYSLSVRGTKYVGTVSAPPLTYYYWGFEPNRVALVGNANARSQKVPAGKTLTSKAIFRFFSTKRNAAWSISVPLALSLSWETSNTVRVAGIGHTAKTSTVTSGELGQANPLSAAAGPGVGLNKVSVQSSATPGAGVGAYTVPANSWAVKTVYETGIYRPGKLPATPNFGLTGTSCAGRAYGN